MDNFTYEMEKFNRFKIDVHQIFKIDILLGESEINIIYIYFTIINNVKREEIFKNYPSNRFKIATAYIYT